MEYKHYSSLLKACVRAGRQKHTLQSVFQELCDKEPNGVPVSSPGQRHRSSRLRPAQLRAEPLEELQLLRWQPCSRHALCSEVGLLRKNREDVRRSLVTSLFTSASAAFTWGWIERQGNVWRAQATCSSFSARVTVQVLYTRTPPFFNKRTACNRVKNILFYSLYKSSNQFSFYIDRLFSCLNSLIKTEKIDFAVTLFSLRVIK